MKTSPLTLHRTVKNTGIGYRFFSDVNASKPNIQMEINTDSNKTIGISSRESFFSELADKEKLAIKRKDDVSSQLIFYKSLLDHHQYNQIIQHYRKPGIASSPECLAIYEKALTMTYPTKNFQNGTRATPLHVVLTETRLTTVFKWVRWCLILGVSIYALSGLTKYISEASGLVNGENKVDRLIDSSQLDHITFDDVRGCDEARAELEEVVDFLKNPTKYETLGGKLPKGILLTGPPGTGKTMLARATAGEAGVDFFFMSGSEFDEVYVGVGAKRIRELFKEARDKRAAIIFIDELDAIGSKRTGKEDNQGGSRQTLNQLLVELDGFTKDENVIIIGATNFPESLDKALTRPGRFDKIVNVDLPDVRGRTDILKHYLKHIHHEESVDVSLIARGTPGLSGAELSNLINQSAVYASRQNAVSVNMSHLEWAKDKILMGAEKKKMAMTEETKRATAFHEAGHALVAKYTKGATPLYKVTILPRGNALGITFQLPEMDKVDITRMECLARLDVSMGGKAAEEFIYGPDNTTSGCLSDLQNATHTARAMVTQYGMNEKVGPVELSNNWETWSSHIRDIADNEVINLLKESEQRAKDLLKRKSKELHMLANSLVEYETLDAHEIDKICRGEELTLKEVRKPSSVTRNSDFDTGRSRMPAF